MAVVIYRTFEWDESAFIHDDGAKDAIQYELKTSSEQLTVSGGLVIATAIW